MSQAISFRLPCVSAKPSRLMIRGCREFPSCIPSNNVQYITELFRSLIVFSSMGFPYIPFFLSLSCIYADIILPVTTTSVNFTSPAIATGVSSVTLIPFDVDFISLPDYQTESAYDRYSNSIWTTKVAVYDDTENFDSVISLSWPAGKGPGAPPVANKTWSACVIAMPDLFTKLNITSQGNGTCFDVVDSDCLYHLMTTALSYWDSSIDGQTNLTDSVLTQACKSAAGLPLISQCFGRSTGSQSSISGRTDPIPCMRWMSRLTT